MAWTARFIMDKDKEVGTATAIWNEGQADEWSISRRFAAAKPELTKFCNWVLAQKAARDVLTPKEQRAIDHMEQRLNG